LTPVQPPGFVAHLEKHVMILQDLFREGDSPITAGPDETVGAVAGRMRSANVGAVVIVHPDRRVAGIVTDRDVALALGSSRATTQSPIHEIMTKDVATMGEGQGVLNATQYLYGRQVRRLPVVDRHDRLVGMVTLDDLLAVLTRELFNVSQAVQLALHEEV
jgi:CBS domain-containing protein